MKKYLLLLLMALLAFQTAEAQGRKQGPNGKWGYLDFDGEILVPFEYDEFVTPILDSLTIVVKNGKKGVINKKGQEIIPCEYTQLQTWQPSFNNMHGLIAVSNTSGSNGWGYIDHKNKVVLPLQYQYVRCIQPNLLAAIPERDTIIQFFNRAGKRLFNIPGKYVEPLKESNGDFMVKNVHGGGGRAVHVDGTFYPPNVIWTSEKHEIYVEKDRYGVRKKDGTILGAADYYDIDPLPGGHFLVKKTDGISGVFDQNGQWIIPQSRTIIEYTKGLFFIRALDKREETRVLDHSGKEVLPIGDWYATNVSKHQAFRDDIGLSSNNYLQIRNIKNESAVFDNGQQITPFLPGYVQYATDAHPFIWLALDGLSSIAANQKGQVLFDQAFKNLHFTADPGVLFGTPAGGENKMGFVTLADRGASAVYEFNNIIYLDHYFLTTVKNGKYQLLDPKLKPIGDREYTYLGTPNQYHKKYFGRMKDFKGKLVAIGEKSDTQSGWVIGINDQGKTYLLNLQAEISKAAASSKNTDYNPPKESPSVVGEDEAPPVIEEIAPPTLELDPSEVMDMPETRAMYPGGVEALYKTMAKDLKYPMMARENAIVGTVIIRFIVEKDGTISQPKIVKDIGGGCGKEALRLVQFLSKFTPAKHQGRVVRSYYTLPVKFSLE